LVGAWVHNGEGNPCSVGGCSPGKQPWSKGKLKEHYTKHGAEFGARNSKEYSEMAIEFGTRPNNGNIIETTKDSFIDLGHQQIQFLSEQSKVKK
jgi:pyocin large subunit-like protein